MKKVLRFIIGFIVVAIVITIAILMFMLIVKFFTIFGIVICTLIFSVSAYEIGKSILK